MTPRQRVLAVLRGEPVDKVPFTVYECMIPQCAAERRLRNEGLCIVHRRGVFRTEHPNCTERTLSYAESGKPRVRTEIETPAGRLSTVREPAGFTSWTLEKLFKGPDDYPALRALVSDEICSPDYESFARDVEWMGEDVIVRGGVGAMPLHQIMIQWMGVETFAVEWADRRDEVLELEKLMAARRRAVFGLVAGSPATHANFGGNETPEVMGPKRYEEFCLPLMRECAEKLHAEGVLLGSHMDANNAAWKHLVAESGMDYVEAFTPAPDTDMTLAEALEAWPGKVLWINFPSSVHLRPPAEIRRVTRELLDAADADAQRSGRNRLIIGITEDMPPGRWQENLLAISAEINWGS